MKYLIYVLAFIPFTICAPGSLPQGPVGFTCTDQRGKSTDISVADTKASVQYTCSTKSSGGNQITEFPKRFTPAFQQRLEATSQTNSYLLNRIQKYPNLFTVTTDDCRLAAVMMARPGGLPQNAAQPVSPRPGSVRTRPGSPVQSVRTRPDAAIAARSESNSRKTKHSSVLEKRAIKGSALIPCRAKMSSYSWDADVSGKGKPLINVPSTARKVPSF